MEVILRPVNDQFLQEVVFPAFELGVVDGGAAFDFLLKHLLDDHTRVALEVLLDTSGSDSLFGLQDPRWTECVYTLLFSEWLRDKDGWVLSNAYTAFAGPWEESFHLALCLEDADYPYYDSEKSDEVRRAFWVTPKRQHGLASLMCGQWDPIPGFPADQILSTAGTGQYNPKAGIARADWSWRPMLTVSQWASRLPNMLSRLLDRETKRLKPVEAPERHEILDYWLGRIEEPPMLAVAFSGLGSRASEWIREIGHLARLIRKAAEEARGVTLVLSTPIRKRDHVMPGG